jgi:hypothetical protein
MNWSRVEGCTDLPILPGVVESGTDIARYHAGGTNITKCYAA